MPLLSPKAAPSSPPLDRPSPSDYVWLAYSVFFFVEPVVRHSRPYWLKNLAIYAIFLAIYILCVQTRSHTRKLASLAGMALLGLAAFPLNPGSACFLSFSAAILPFTIESTSAVVLSVTLASIVTVLEGHLLRLSWPDYTISVFMMIVVGTSNLFIAQRKRATTRLLRAQDEIEHLAALAERERIARDMHDVLGPTLSVIVLKSELAGRLLTRNPATAVSAAAAIQELADIESTARKALSDVRETITGYRAQGLPAEIDHARRTLATAGVSLTANLAPHLHLSATRETVLSLAVREAVTNVIRHARATSCALHLTVTPAGEHTLILIDNGNALDTPPREGNGLRGMRERVSALGGALTLTPSPSGTTLRIDLPSTTAIAISTQPAPPPPAAIPSGAKAPRISALAPADTQPEPLPQ